MKKVLLLLCTAVCIIISSCHKDAKVIPADYYFTASKNSAGWGAAATAYTITGDSLQLQGFRQTGEEHLLINIKSNSPGIYTVTGRQAKFFTTIGMDAITSSYKLDDTHTSTVTITSYNAETRIISGTFQLFMLKDSPGDYVQLILDNGHFRVKLSN